MDAFLFELVDIAGTIAFAFSGALVGVRRRLDLFGVLTTALATAVGGGIMRDVILGIIPPTAFVNPRDAMIAICVGFMVFLFIQQKGWQNNKHIPKLNELYVVSDAMGLGMFVVVGMNAGINQGYTDNAFLLVFVGLITGVGGGIIRDVLCCKVPHVLRGGDLYASAAIMGGIFYYILLDTTAPRSLSMILTVTLITLIRMASLSMNLNLPVAHKAKIADAQKNETT